MNDKTEAITKRNVRLLIVQTADDHRKQHQLSDMLESYEEGTADHMLLKHVIDQIGRVGVLKDNLYEAIGTVEQRIGRIKRHMAAGIHLNELGEIQQDIDRHVTALETLMRSTHRLVVLAERVLEREIL